MLWKACPRCKKIIPHGLPYCATCAPLAEAEREAKRERKAEYLRKKYQRKYNSKRDPKYIAFYRSKEWKATSRAKMADAHYKCEAKLAGCTTIAVEVHHVKPIQTDEGWHERLEWDNLKAVCIACHNTLHDRFKSWRKKDDGALDMREIIKNL